MFVDEVAALFRLYVDESDDTFLNAANVTTLLKLAANDRIKLIGMYDNTVFREVVDIVLSNVTEYDFALTTNPVRLLGKPVAGLTGPRLDRLIEIVTKQVNVQPFAYCPWTGVKSLHELTQGNWNTYLFAGTKLFFPYTQAATITVVYRPMSSVDWSKQTAGDNERIDDLEQTHELIALLAAQRYFILDSAKQEPINDAIAKMTADLDREMCLGRDFSGSVAMSMTYRP